MIINLDYTSEIPIYLQLRNEIVKGIANGHLNTASHYQPLGL